MFWPLSYTAGSRMNRKKKLLSEKLVYLFGMNRTFGHGYTCVVVSRWTPSSPWYTIEPKKTSLNLKATPASVDRSYKPGHVWWSPSICWPKKQLIFNIAHMSTSRFPGCWWPLMWRKNPVGPKFGCHTENTDIMAGHVCHNVNPGLINPVYSCLSGRVP